MSGRSNLLAGTFVFLAGCTAAVESEGVLMLLGVMLLLVAGGIAVVVLMPERSRLISLGKGINTAAFLEPGSLVRSLQRSLRVTVHPEVTVHHKGRYVVIAAPQRGSGGSHELIDEVASRMPAELENRGVPHVKYRIESGRTVNRRVR